jgi:predicted transcriptional regulator
VAPGDLAAGGIAATAGALLLRVLLPLSTRRSATELLEHPLRHGLHRSVQSSPGSTVAQLAAATGTGRTTADYHLRLLERAGAIWSRREGRVRRCYARGHPGSASLGFSSWHPKAQRLATVVAALPGVGLSEAARRADVSPSLASFHLAHLVASGAVRRERRGTRVRFYPAET